MAQGLTGNLMILVGRQHLLPGLQAQSGEDETEALVVLSVSAICAECMQRYPAAASRLAWVRSFMASDSMKVPICKASARQRSGYQKLKEPMR
jgi:hypothetical protein